jgi:hypothetical protein
MHWFRSQIGGTWVALFALALQMAVSFGHLHADELGASFAGSDRMQSASAVVTQASPHQADHEHSPAPDDYCPVCASMALVGTAIASSPPTPTLPMAVRYFWPSPVPATGAGLRLTLSFQARAPPSV